MLARTQLTTVFVLLTTFGTPPISAACLAQDNELRALEGEWLYVEDRTEGRAVEEQQPPMSAKFTLRVEKDAVVMPRSSGEDRILLDGSVLESASKTSTTRRRGTWKDGVLEYETEILRVSDKSRIALIRRKFRPTPNGLLVHIEMGETKQIAFYRHPQDIKLPTPAKGKIADVAWLAGAWVGSRGKSSTEERWSPPRGGAMLGLSRTVRAEKMRAFEYLRIVERDDGLIYIAQPGGRTPTEFVLTKLDKRQAVFENPRHDFPQRIVYELSAQGDLSASIGFIRGGRPRRFNFKPEPQK